jgi:uncharacterized membrane protein YccC
VARLRRPTVAELQVALRAAVSAGLSIVVADALGLKDSYWAAISAVVATGPTVGASLGAALTRIAATVAGLLVGLAAFAVAGDGTLVAAVAVFAALLVLPAVSLDAGVRLGAATTLIVTAIPGDAFVDALERGANVPLGCALAVAVGLLLWPARAAERLRRTVTQDVEDAGALAQRALDAYAGGVGGNGIREQAASLAARERAWPQLLRDAMREPGGATDAARTTAAARRLLDDLDSLVVVVEESDGDRAPELLREDVVALGAAIAAAASAYGDARAAGFSTAVARARDASDRLASSFSAVRERRGTTAYETDEVVRLLTVIHASRALVRSLGELRPL